MPLPDLDLLAGRYGLEGVRIVRPMPHSYANEAFHLASTRGDLVLRRLFIEDLQSLSDRHYFMAYLRGRDFPVPAPLVARDGETVALIDGVAYDLYPFVEGAWSLRWSRAQVAAAARSLAQLHGLADDYPEPLRAPEPGFRRQFLEAAGRFPGYLEAAATLPPEAGIGDELEYLASVVSDLEGWMLDLPRLGLPEGIIHGDFVKSNVLFCGDGLSAVLDFDKSRRETRALDVAIAVSQAARGGADGVADWGLARLFVEEYAAVRPLSRPGGEALPGLIRARTLKSVLAKLGKLVVDPVEKQSRRASKLRKYVRLLRAELAFAERWEPELGGRRG